MERLRLLFKYKIWILFIALIAGFIGSLTVFVRAQPVSPPFENKPIAQSKKIATVLDEAAKLRLNESYGKLPLCFEPNPITGTEMVPPEVRFISKGPGYTLFITPIEAVFALSKARSLLKSEVERVNPPSEKEAVLRLRLLGSNQKASCEGTDSLSGVRNYYIGSDPSQWRANVPQYGKVKFKDVYPGVDMVYYGNQQKLEYDFVVKPGADPKKICLKWEGAKSAKVDGKGNLVLKAAGGQIVFKAPVVYQMKGGERTYLGGRYALARNHQLRFEVASYDSSRPLIIDPQLDYSTYLGGTLDDEGYGIAVDASGEAYVVGHTNSTNFPTSSLPAQSTNGSSSTGVTYNLFVAKFNSSATGLIFSTYLGGSGPDFGRAIAVDSAGNAYIAGKTGSISAPFFPTTANCYQPTIGSATASAVLVKLSSTGALMYSTCLGSANNSFARSIAVDSNGYMYVTGDTNSTTFPTTGGGYQTSYNGGTQAFVTEINPAGGGSSDLLYSTYLGGSSGPTILTRGFGIALNANDIFVTGYTTTTNFPAGNGPAAYQPSNSGVTNAFVAEINPAGGTNGLIYSTYLGGNGGDDEASKIAVDSNGKVYLAGLTNSSNFPITGGAFQTTYGGGAYDVFVAKLDPTLSGVGGLLYSTYLGGSGDDEGMDIKVDPSGLIYVTGFTSSSNFPTTSGAYQTVFGGGADDAFVAQINPSGNSANDVINSTYLGGSGKDTGQGIALDQSGNVYVTGITGGGGFPTTSGVIQSTYGNGIADAFAAKFDVSNFYSPTPTNTVTACYLDMTSSQVVNPGTYSYCAVTIESGATMGIAGPVTFNMSGNFVVIGGINMSASGVNGNSVNININGGNFVMNPGSSVLGNDAGMPGGPSG